MVQLELMRIRFGQLELDEERFLLQRGGVRIEIRPKVFDLLALLIRSRERVVLREELVMTLWGTTAIGLGALSGLVNELRQVLGEVGRGPSSIRTVHGRGYQFIAPVKLGEREDPSGRTIEWAGSTGERLEGTAPVGSGEFAAARRRIRASIARVSAEGPRASLIIGPAESGRIRVFDHAKEDLSKAGFEVHLPIRLAGTDRQPDSLVDFLVATLVESHGAEVIRSAIPVRARELSERIAGRRPTSHARLRDPLASRQYEERVWRSLGELLRGLAEVRPFALLLDDRKETAGVALRTASRLLNLLGDARVFILSVARDAAGDGWERSDDAAEPAIDVVRLEPIDRTGLNELLEARGVPGLPAAIAEALAAHVQGDMESLESVAKWLRAERDRETPPPAGSERAAPDRRMKRVEPNSSTRSTRFGTAS